MTRAGTGKTVIAAFDYKNFRKKHLGEACRRFFVAHREEILTTGIKLTLNQALAVRGQPLQIMDELNAR